MNIVVTITPAERDTIISKLRHSIRSIEAHGRQREALGRGLEPHHAKRIVDYSLLITKLEGTRK